MIQLRRNETFEEGHAATDSTFSIFHPGFQAHIVTFLRISTALHCLFDCCFCLFVPGDWRGLTKIIHFSSSHLHTSLIVCKANAVQSSKILSMSICNVVKWWLLPLMGPFLSLMPLPSDANTFTHFASPSRYKKVLENKKKFKEI